MTQGFRRRYDYRQKDGPRYARLIQGVSREKLLGGHPGAHFPGSLEKKKLPHGFLGPTPQGSWAPAPSSLYVPYVLLPK